MTAPVGSTGSRLSRCRDEDSGATARRCGAVGGQGGVVIVAEELLHETAHIGDAICGHGWQPHWLLLPNSGRAGISTSGVLAPGTELRAQVKKNRYDEPFLDLKGKVQYVFNVTPQPLVDRTFENILQTILGTSWIS